MFWRRVKKASGKLAGRRSAWAASARSGSNGPLFISPRTRRHGLDGQRPGPRSLSLNRRFSAQRLGEHRDGFLCVLQASVLKRLLLGSWPRCAMGKSWKLSMNQRFSAQSWGGHRDGFLCVLSISALKTLRAGSWPRFASKCWRFSLPMNLCVLPASAVQFPFPFTAEARRAQRARFRGSMRVFVRGILFLEERTRVRAVRSSQPR